MIGPPPYSFTSSRSRHQHRHHPSLQQRQARLRDYADLHGVFQVMVGVLGTEIELCLEQSGRPQVFWIVGW